MINSPELDRTQERMKPGMISRIGFLGDDSRPLGTVIEEDAQRVSSLRLADAAIVTRLRELTDAARGGLGTPVTAEGLEMRTDEARGVMPCPWPHPAVFRKGSVYCRRLDTGEEIVWTELSMHMIETHGFYGGAGSPYRLSPNVLKRVLAL